MESIEVQQSQQTKAASHWITNPSRKLVFAVLNKMKNACIEFQEAGQVFILGNVEADLKGIIEIKDNSVYKDFITGGSIAAGEAYIEHKWSSPDLTKVIQVFARSQVELDEIEKKIAWLSKIKQAFFHKKNQNSENGSKKNILAHYDLGNDLYTRFLDPNMQYSSAIYADNTQDLDAAQVNKLNTICHRLALTSDDTLIEIGTGWGGLAIHAAQHFGCQVTTTTISDAQFEYASNKVKALGLTDKVTLLKQDYRQLTGHYDKLVSIEMIEAVGDEFLAGFFAKCDSLLKPGGKMLIQAITIADQRYDYYLNNVDFIQRYIFPGGCLPSIAVMSEHIAQQTNMVIEGLHDIGLDYAKTLVHWRERFEQNWLEISQQNSTYNEDFKRLWHYYLCYCEGGFNERAISTVHLLVRKS